MPWKDNSQDFRTDLPVEICLTFERPETSASVCLIADTATNRTLAYCKKIGSRVYCRTMTEKIDQSDIKTGTRPSISPPNAPSSTRGTSPAGETNPKHAWQTGRFNAVTGEFVADPNLRPVTRVPKCTKLCDESGEMFYQQDCSSRSSSPAGRIAPGHGADPGANSSMHPKAAQGSSATRQEPWTEEEETLLNNHFFVPASENKSCNPVPSSILKLLDARYGVKGNGQQANVTHQAEGSGVPRKVADTTGVDYNGTGRHPSQQDGKNHDPKEKPASEIDDFAQAKEEEPVVRAPVPKAEAFFFNMNDDEEPCTSRREELRKKMDSRSGDRSKSRQKKEKKPKEDDERAKSGETPPKTVARSTPREATRVESAPTEVATPGAVPGTPREATRVESAPTEVATPGAVPGATSSQVLPAPAAPTSEPGFLAKLSSIFTLWGDYGATNALPEPVPAIDPQPPGALPSTSLPSTSLPSTSLPSTSLPSTSLPSTSQQQSEDTANAVNNSHADDLEDESKAKKRESSARQKEHKERARRHQSMPRQQATTSRNTASRQDNDSRGLQRSQSCDTREKKPAYKYEEPVVLTEEQIKQRKREWRKKASDGYKNWLKQILPPREVRYKSRTKGRKAKEGDDDAETAGNSRDQDEGSPDRNESTSRDQPSTSGRSGPRTGRN